jgi:thiamine-phosphate pyrophosphorylase
MTDDLNQTTAAAHRALETARRCFDASRRGEITSRAMLLALASEPESRAASILARHGIDLEAVRRQWPGLVDQAAHEHGETPPTWGVSQICSALGAAIPQAGGIGPQPELTTEHLLLALVAGSDETADWLRRQGLCCEEVAAECRRWSGVGKPQDIPLSAGCMADPGSAGQPSPGGETGWTPVLRVLDAAANRAAEALRSIEDFVRFVLDDKHLTGLGKQLRHDLAAALRPIPLASRLAARETELDVGISLTTPAEQRRLSPDDLLTAGFARLQEALRSLEEFGKLENPEMAATVKQLRYRSYTLHRAVAITHSSMERLADARLYVLLDGGRSVAEFEALAQSLVEAGVHVVQLRDKRLDDRELLDRARRLRAVTRATETSGGARPLFVVNDRPDLAVLSRADGVHVGQEELRAKDVRAIVGPEMLVGVSTHSIEQARQAVLDGANYIGCGPTFPSATKQFERFPGLEFLRRVASEIRLPAFAIGGIGPENLGDVLATGIGRVAVGGAITQAADPAAAARAMFAALASGAVRPSDGVME